MQKQEATNFFRYYLASSASCYRVGRQSILILLRDAHTSQVGCGGFLLFLTSLFPPCQRGGFISAPEGLSIFPDIHLYHLAAEDRIQLFLLSCFAACEKKTKCSSFVARLRYSRRKPNNVLLTFKTIVFA